MDKIRILLLDDMPDWTFDEEGENRSPQLPEEWEAHFELLWLQNAEESRWLLDAFSLLATRVPRATCRTNLPPELLVFDYALTQGGNRSRTERDPTNVIPRLRSLLKEYSLDVQEKVPPPPPTGTPLGKDRTGCYVGGELARVFGAHPCGAVPTTAHVDTSNTDAAFYEWLNRQYFMGLFDDKGRGDPSWDILIPIGVKSLRARMEQLAMPGLLRMSPSALQRLLEAPTQMRNGSLTMHSCYGPRTLPIAGLFADVLPPVKENDSGFAAEAKKWAGKWLAALFGGFGCNEFTEARDLATAFYNAFVSRAHDDRYDLSHLAALERRNPEQEAALDSLCAKFSLPPDRVRSAPDAIPVTHNTLKPLRTEARGSDEVARWAALMLAVRAEQYQRQATEDWIRWGQILRDTAEEGEVPLEMLVDRLGDEVVVTLLSELDLQPRTERSGQFIDLPISRNAQLDDILSMLEPLPERLLMYWHKGKPSGGAGKRGKDQTLVTNPLKRLGHSGTGWGPLGLNLLDVLENHPFDCAVCRVAIAARQVPPTGEHKDGSGQRYSHGLRAGEGPLLRVYADEIGFPEPKWPRWLADAL